MRSVLFSHSRDLSSFLLRFRSTYAMMHPAGIHSNAVTSTTVPTMLSRKNNNTLFMLISSIMSQNRSTTSWMVFSQLPYNENSERDSFGIFLAHFKTVKKCLHKVSTNYTSVEHWVECINAVHANSSSIYFACDGSTVPTKHLLCSSSIYYNIHKITYFVSKVPTPLIYTISLKVIVQ